MEMLTTIADRFRDTPLARLGFASVVAFGLVAFPLQAIQAHHLKGGSGSQHVDEYGEQCQAGCDTSGSSDDICCNDPIGG